MDIQITTTTGNLELLQSGLVTFEEKDGVFMRIGNINVRFEVLPGEKDKGTQLETVPDEKTLTVIYKISGTIPKAPFSYGLFKPVQIGTSTGTPLFILWRLSALHKEEEKLYDLSFSVFRAKENR